MISRIILRSGFVTVGALVALSFAVPALAQQTISLPVRAEGGEYAEGATEMYLSDPTILLQVLPPVEDLASEDSADDGAVEPTVVLGPGVQSLFEVSAAQKSFVVGPYYRLKERLWLKARVPLIFERKLTYVDSEPSASGLGDVSLQADYLWPLRMTGSELRTRLDVKLPTGDADNVEDGYLVPLGTGSWDFMLGAQFSRRLPTFGFVSNLSLRKNTADTRTVELVDATGVVLSTTESDITNGGSLAWSAFGWRSLTPKVALHLGVSLLVVGNGETEFVETVHAAGTKASGSYENGQGMTLLDLYPGVSYNLGKINPFLGVRLPVMSSYDADGDREDRDVAVLLQFTYQPGRMRHDGAK